MFEIIAENINVMSKTIGPAMKNRETGPIEDFARKLEANGADYLDLNVGPARKNGEEMMEWIVKTVQGVSNLPLVLDTTNIDVMEAGLKAYNAEKAGKPIINSISAIPERMDAMLPLVQKYNAKFVALMYAKEGIPRDTNERGVLAADIVFRAMDMGIANEDMYIDPIVVPVSSQQNQVISCTEFTGMIQDIAPGACSTCGLSNISNGGPEELRELVNQVYLIMLIEQGMTSAILDGFDKEIIAIAKGQRPELVEIVKKAMAGEAIDFAGLDKQKTDFAKTVRILTGETLYSDSWLEL